MDHGQPDAAHGRAGHVLIDCRANSKQVHHFQERRRLLDFVKEDVLRPRVCSDHSDEIFGGGGEPPG